ncbi:MAG: hypothetical protein U1F11_10095 [Steroidobacteraceae bacterium]
MATDSTPARTVDAAVAGTAAATRAVTSAAAAGAPARPAHEPGLPVLRAAPGGVVAIEIPAEAGPAGGGAPRVLFDGQRVLLWPRPQGGWRAIVGLPWRCPSVVRSSRWNRVRPRRRRWLSRCAPGATPRSA